jgi:hypothetical protein
MSLAPALTVTAGNTAPWSAAKTVLPTRERQAKAEGVRRQRADIEKIRRRRSSKRRAQET